VGGSYGGFRGRWTGFTEFHFYPIWKFSNEGKNTAQKAPGAS